MSENAALDLLASLKLEDERRWGEAAESWQWADARAILVDRWRLAYITRPRGASKTTDIAGIGIAALLEQLPAASRSYAVAADRDQAGLIVDAINGFVTRTGLSSLLKVDTWKVTALRTGASLEVLAADAAGAWGKLPHLLIADERAQWKTTPEPERLWRAMFSALPKVRSSRLVILTTAGDPSHPAGKLIKRARKSRRWYVNELPGPCPWTDPDDLAEQAEELPEWEYRRLHLNQWVASEDRLTTADDLAACVTLLSHPLPYDSRWPYAIGVDLATKGDRSVVVVCHLEPRMHVAEVGQHTRRNRVVLDRIGVWQGTRQAPLALSVVEEFIGECARQYGSPPVIFDPFQAISMEQRLEATGVRTLEYPFTSASVGRLGLVLHQLIRNHDLALPDDAELIDELANVRVREVSPGVVRLDHDHGRHDDRAVALALAAQHLLGQPMSDASPLQRESWRYWTVLPDPAIGDQMVQSWFWYPDRRIGGAYAVGQVWAALGPAWGRKDGGKPVYLIEQVRVPMTVPEVSEAMALLAVRWPEAHTTFVPSHDGDDPVVDSIVDGVTGVVPISPPKSWEATARALGPEFEAGRVLFPNPVTTSWLPALLSELGSPFGRDEPPAVCAALMALPSLLAPAVAATYRDLRLVGRR